MRAAGSTDVVKLKDYWQCKTLFVSSEIHLLTKCSSEQSTGVIRIYDGRGDDKPLVVVDKLHRSPVHLMTVSSNVSPLIISLRTLCNVQFSDRYDTVISADENGFVEFWRPTEPFEPPKNVPGMWSYKSATDLYEFKKVRHALAE
jgi:peptidylprolyl isomerase domain and WD repeat-containing protein 1